MTEAATISSEPILKERQTTHGDYNEVSRISQDIRKVLKTGYNWDRMNDCQREALEMMCSKIGRIMSGNYNFRDHWDDIAGYAKLGGIFSLIEKDLGPRPEFEEVHTTNRVSVVKLSIGDLDGTEMGP